MPSSTTLNNMGLVYRATGQPGKALELYEQALLILREMGDRAGEAITCFNMAMLARELGQPQRALDMLRQAVRLEEQVQHLDSPHAAFANGEPLPGSSSTTPSSSGLSPEQVQTIQHNTLAVLTDVPERHTEWRQTIAEALSRAEAARIQTDIQFFTAILTLLDGGLPEISPENPYAAAIQALSRQLTQSEQRQTIQEGSPLPSDLPADFMVRCVAGLKGSLENKEALFEYLRDVNRKTSSPDVSTLIKHVQILNGEKIPLPSTPLCLSRMPLSGSRSSNT